MPFDLRPDDDASPGPLSDEPALDLRLELFDSILDAVAQHDRDAITHETERHEEQLAFLDGFARVCKEQIRPAMEAVLSRVSAHGGGGVIEEHPGGEPRVRLPRLTLWLSLEGPLVGEPRPDRHAYLQLEGDPVAKDIVVSEGDMWQGLGGGTSGRVGTWALTETTGQRVALELLAVATRAAA